MARILVLKYFLQHIKHYPFASVLALNGDLPPASFFKATKHAPLIAADGAINKLLKKGIIPHALVGDFDSLDPRVLKSLPASCHIHYAPHQSMSDFEKSLDYIHTHYEGPPLIVGLSGGFFDHIFYNISVLQKNTCAFYAPPLMGYIFKDPGAYSFHLPINTKISLFGGPLGRISTKGLFWEVVNDTLAFPHKSSAFNRVNAPIPTITLHEGTLCLMIYLRDQKDRGMINTENY